MRRLLVDAAAREIRQTCQRAAERKERAERSPFVFIVGAGISHPQVSLASQIVEHCRQEARHWKHVDDPLSKAPVDVYSHWFGHAYPQACDRQEYLRRMMETAHISRANFRLAHVLLDGAIARIVVTPNFDDLLSRALSLFGRRQIICDHPQTVERISVESDDVQIVHVHGTYWFYDCANLKDEVDRASYVSGLESFTMSSLLDDIFRGRAPLVIGYSGWEGDVIMSALRRRLAKALPRNIYWFCHKHADAEALPQWLRDSSSLVVVVPDDDRSAHRLQSEPAGSLSSPQSDPVLDATQVLDTLIREFGLEPPALTKDPLSFFAQQLRGSLWADDASHSDDVYGIRALIDRVENARVRETIPASGRDAELEAVRVALRRSEYRDAIRLGKQIDLSLLDPVQLKEVTTAMFSAGESLFDNSPDELEAYRLAVRAGDLLTGSSVAESRVTSTVAKALLFEGLTLSAMNKRSEAVDIFSDIVRRHRESDDDELRGFVARALVGKGYELGRLNQNSESLAAYDQVVSLFGVTSNLALNEAVAKALIAKGQHLSSLSRVDEAVATYDEVVTRFAHSSEAALQAHVAHALVSKGVQLITAGRGDDAIAAYDEVVSRVADAPGPALRGHLAMALFHKAASLESLGRSSEAVTAYEELARRFAGATELGVRRTVAEALFNRGCELSQLGREDEALSAYDDVVRTFGDAAEPTLREVVSRALYNKGDLLGKRNQGQAACLIFDEITARFAEDPNLAVREVAARGLASKASALETLGHLDEAANAYEDVVRRFGASSEGTLPEKVAAALLGKATVLVKLNRSNEAVTAFEDIVGRFRNESRLALRETVARALAKKGRTLNLLNRGPEALFSFGEVIHRFGEAQEVALREAVADALLGKGLSLVRLGRVKDAVSAYDEVLRRFGDSNENPLEEAVAQAVAEKINLATPSGLRRSRNRVPTKSVSRNRARSSAKKRRKNR